MLSIWVIRQKIFKYYLASCIYAHVLRKFRVIYSIAAHILFTIGASRILCKNLARIAFSGWWKKGNHLLATNKLLFTADFGRKFLLQPSSCSCMYFLLTSIPLHARMSRFAQKQTLCKNARLAFQKCSIHDVCLIKYTKNILECILEYLFSQLIESKHLPIR